MVRFHVPRAGVPEIRPLRGILSLCHWPVPPPTPARGVSGVRVSSRANHSLRGKAPTPIFPRLQGIETRRPLEPPASRVFERSYSRSAAGLG